MPDRLICSPGEYRLYDLLNEQLDKDDTPVQRIQELSLQLSFGMLKGKIGGAVDPASVHPL